MRADLNKVRFLVILYGKPISRSKTITSLLASIVSYSLEQTELVIWSNGPEPLSDCSEELFEAAQALGLNVVIKEDLKNPSLSTIYNLHCEEVEQLVILDDDTQISEDYLASLADFTETEGVSLFVPVIKAQGMMHYPKTFEGNQVIEDATPGVHSYKPIRSVASGLALKRGLIERLKRKYNCVFDERLALYGIDTSLFRRCRASAIRSFYLGNPLEHELSGVVSEGPISAKRLEERFYDFVLQFRHDFRPGNLTGILCFMKVHGLRPELWCYLPRMLRCFITGRHPRAGIAVNPDILMDSQDKKSLVNSKLKNKS